MLVTVTAHREGLIKRGELQQMTDWRAPVNRTPAPENGQNLTQASRQNQIETDINSENGFEKPHDDTKTERNATDVNSPQRGRIHPSIKRAYAGNPRRETRFY